MNNPATDLVTSRTINATREKIFAAISDPKRLARWWGPAGFSNTFDSCEFKTGGQWKFTMHGPDGKDYPNENRFVEIKIPERVVIRHVSAPYFTLTISLTVQGDKTRLDWRQSFDEAATCAALREICEPANEQNLDRLAAEVLGLPTDSHPLIQLVYISQAVQHLTAGELNKILTEARKSNQEKNITGMLLYRDGLFIQVIEGADDSIDQLYTNIRKDTRHRNVHLVLRETVSKREFADWTMGFRDISQDMDGANDFMQQQEYSLNKNLQPSAARKLLTTFRDMG